MDGLGAKITNYLAVKGLKVSILQLLAQKKYDSHDRFYYLKHGKK